MMSDVIKNPHTVEDLEPGDDQIMERIVLYSENDKIFWIGPKACKDSKQVTYVVFIL